MLAESPVQLVHGYVFLGHVRGNHLTVVDQQAGRSLDQLAELAIHAGNFSQNVIQDEQNHSRHNAAHQGSVGPGHRVLHRVAQQQKQRQVKGRHLADFAFAREPDPQQDQYVDDGGAQDDFKRSMPVCEHCA